MKRKRAIVIACSVIAFLLLSVFVLLPNIMLLMWKSAFNSLKNAESMCFQYDWTYIFPKGPEHVIYEVWKNGDDFLQFKTYEDGSKDVSVIKDDTEFILHNYADANWDSIEQGKSGTLNGFWAYSDWDIFDKSTMNTKFVNGQLQISLIERVPDGCLVGQNLRRHWTFHFSLQGELKAISLKQLAGSNTDLSSSPIDACYTFMKAEQDEIIAMIDQYHALIEN